MSASIRSYFQPLMKLKDAYFHPYEDFGRANIFRAVLVSYVGVYFAAKWNSERKAKALKAEKIAKKESVVKDALARAGF
ncbi:Hypothetical protein SRAE_1000122600 [Strongyloides ratti]|uniref:ATP synthase subunit e, mitochondrial n=1 Tax=Strongyloides ratti TaxID=34506 RepID=A0A090KZK0_STRRB|nr:Hypothetical protein SRAE_1000122600 [Strongyloides ratti]CEF62960.1 Hypothetical protein SRAE_1000122600 [Strongyloides ratti]